MGLYYNFYFFLLFAMSIDETEFIRNIICWVGRIVEQVGWLPCMQTMWVDLRTHMVPQALQEKFLSAVKSDTYVLLGVAPKKTLYISIF